MEGLDEWEVLSESGGGFLDIHEDDGSNFSTLSDNLFKNYFRCPSPRTASSPPPPPLPNHHQLAEAEEEEKKIVVTHDLTITNHHPTDVVEIDDDKDPNFEEELLISSSSPKKQVFFVKKETLTEFVDMMKLDLESPKSNKQLSRPSSPTQLMGHQFESGEQAAPDAQVSSPRKMMMMMIDDQNDDDDDVVVEDQDQINQGGTNMNNNNILKWSLSGIGAICSFGVATVCIFVLGGLIKNSGHSTARKPYHDQHPPPHHQKLQFHIYAEDKRLLKHESTKLNEAISAVRDIPFSRAHITFGGYCDHLHHRAH
ncbi:OLC1v1038267C1 [Oldenlandia corymbosa var. corymbosa]|uniref:OLC1v1038267C1 n=1 Tax=Oldenlandia corymbosa var. corymbosa TaxID=529605 RepID=A0AAV1D0C5_OLDCO|nr:OLC1v1038267C1 [Oldenlandia corymbosa var. corymbosa]